MWCSSWPKRSRARDQCGCRVLQGIWERADLSELARAQLASQLAAEESLPELLCHKYGNFVVASAILHAPSDAVRAWWLDCALPPEQMRSFWSTWCWWQCQGQKSDPVGTPPLCKAAYKIIWLSLRQLAETELSHFVQSWLLKACPDCGVLLEMLLSPCDNSYGRALGYRK